MAKHSVIFIENPDYERLEKPKSKTTFYASLSQLKQLPLRIYSSFVPPVLGEKSRRVYVDFVGPLIALIILGFLLNIGHSYKHPLSLFATPPYLSLILYSSFLPSFCFLLVKLGKSDLQFIEIISLLGYGLYGHIFTILACALIDFQSNFIFFLSLIVFGGLSGFKIVVVLLMTIPKPGARLIVCSLVTVFHLLFLVFIHFAYMHKTFKYGDRH